MESVDRPGAQLTGQVDQLTGQVDQLTGQVVQLTGTAKMMGCPNLRVRPAASFLSPFPMIGFTVLCEEVEELLKWTNW